MSRVSRKEDPKIHSWITRNQNIISVSLNLDRLKLSSRCQAHWAETAFLSSIDAAVEF